VDMMVDHVEAVLAICVMRDIDINAIAIDDGVGVGREDLRHQRVLCLPLRDAVGHRSTCRTRRPTGSARGLAGARAAQACTTNTHAPRASATNARTAGTRTAAA